MKTKSFLTMLLLALVTLTASAERVNLQAGKIGQPGGFGGIPKSPVEIPIVDLDDHTLYFTTSCVGDTLQLVQNGVVVYSTVIASDEVELPATLEGEFEIQIIHDNWLFYGDIEL
ncbi:MAG: hypothetical protein IJS97_01315 [Prevotella sp.]|nr:hypothetical protein [Prevotella sp.]